MFNKTRRLNIVMVGGSGHLGTLLSNHFHSAGHDVTVVARNATSQPWRTVRWDGRTLGDWTIVINGADVVINLAGRSVDCRYNQRNRREIMESRVLTTKLVGDAIVAAEAPPAVWLNSSTATIYRHSLDRPMDELTGELGGDEPGAPSTWNFSIDVAKSWEAAFFAAKTRATRKVALRSAMVMFPAAGSVFDVLSRLVRLGLGGKAGSGRQFMSWVHGNDFIRAIEFLIAREEIEGVVNIASPNPVPNADFMRALREAWTVPFGLPAAEWMIEIRTFLLRTESELILKSRRVVPGRLLDAGFTFEFPEWKSAAQNLARAS
jgi:uncharacterized protein